MQDYGRDKEGGGEQQTEEGIESLATSQERQKEERRVRENSLEGGQQRSKGERLKQEIK